MHSPFVGGFGQSGLAAAPLPVPVYVHGFVQIVSLWMLAQRLYVPVQAGSTPPSATSAPLLWPVPPPPPDPELIGFLHVMPKPEEEPPVLLDVDEVLDEEDEEDDVVPDELALDDEDDVVGELSLDEHATTAEKAPMVMVTTAAKPGTS